VSFSEPGVVGFCRLPINTDGTIDFQIEKEPGDTAAAVSTAGEFLLFKDEA
jgi:hypothetical protein